MERGERERDGLRARLRDGGLGLAPDPEIEVELLTGSPRAPQGFCADGRTVAKIEKGWLYLWVLYWTITTMTTIGYGDISPRTSLEVLLTIVVELIGTVLFGWMLGNIANLLAEFNQYETAYKMRMEQIKAHCLPQDPARDEEARAEVLRTLPHQEGRHARELGHATAADAPRAAQERARRVPDGLPQPARRG